MQRDRLDSIRLHCRQPSGHAQARADGLQAHGAAKRLLRPAGDGGQLARLHAQRALTHCVHQDDMQKIAALNF